MDTNEPGLAERGLSELVERIERASDELSVAAGKLQDMAFSLLTAAETLAALSDAPDRLTAWPRTGMHRD